MSDELVSELTYSNFDTGFSVSFGAKTILPNNSTEQFAFEAGIQLNIGANVKHLNSKTVMTNTTDTVTIAGQEVTVNLPRISSRDPKGHGIALSGRAVPEVAQFDFTNGNPANNTAGIVGAGLEIGATTAWNFKNGDVGFSLDPKLSIKGNGSGANLGLQTRFSVDTNGTNPNYVLTGIDLGDLPDANNEIKVDNIPDVPLVNGLSVLATTSLEDAPQISPSPPTNVSRNAEDLSIGEPALQRPETPQPKIEYIKTDLGSTPTVSSLIDASSPTPSPTTTNIKHVLSNIQSGAQHLTNQGLSKGQDMFKQIQHLIQQLREK